MNDPYHSSQIPLDTDSTDSFAQSSNSVNRSKIVQQHAVTGTSLASLRRKYWLGLSLHLSLVFVHVTLIAMVYAGHIENRISVPLGTPANIASVVIVVVTQVINQAGFFVHDQYNAWTGFGAACMTLLKQYHLPASVWSVVAVTMYLLCVSVLYITVPATFSLATFNKSIPGNVYLKPNIPNFSSGSVHEDLEGPVSFLPMMGTLSNTNTTIGLQGNILSTQLAVDDGLVRQNGTGTDGVWNITSDIMGQNPNDPALYGESNAPIRWLAPYAIRFLPLNVEDTTVPRVVGQTALFYASVNTTDDQGRNGTWLDLDPQMQLASDEHVDVFAFRSWKPTVVACNMYTEVKNITLGAHSRNISSSALNRTVRSTWQQWQQPEKSDDPLVLGWGSIFNINALSTIPVTFCHLPWEYSMSNATCKYDEYMTVPEKFVNDYLGIRLATQYGVKPNVTLAKLELALEDMTAAIYWSAANYAANNGHLDGYNYPPGLESNMNIAVQVSDPAAQLNLNSTPLLVGFLASLTLLALFFWIIRTPENHATLHAEMTMTGLQQLIWLLGTGSSAQDKVASVDFPSTDNLRQAANFEVCMDTLVRQEHIGLRHRTWDSRRGDVLEVAELERLDDHGHVPDEHK